MKKLILLILVATTIFSCKRKPTTTLPDYADITIQFHNKVAGQPVEHGKLNYTNAAGSVYSVTMLKYYVTNVVMTTDDNVDIKLNNYDLIDAFDTQNFSTVFAKSLPNATYKSMRFSLGVDSTRNHTGAQDGDLDPMHNMIWNWNTGYLFLKHEGKFINNIGDTTNLQYHLGTDLAYSIISVPINLKVDGLSRTLNLEFDLNKMYTNPVIDFNSGNIRHSTMAGDKAWINDMIINAQGAFKFLSVN